MKASSDMNPAAIDPQAVVAEQLQVERGNTDSGPGREASGALNFSDRNREAHLAALRDWLPAELRDCGLHWENLSSRAIGYLVRAELPMSLRPPVALAVGSALSGLALTTLYNYVARLCTLFKELHTLCGVTTVEQLARPGVWDEYARKSPRNYARMNQLGVYEAIVGKYQRALLRHSQYGSLAKWRLPPLPAGYVDAHSHKRVLEQASKQSRRAQVDVVAPLYPALSALVGARLNVMRRFLRRYREALAEIKAGDELPYRFEYEEEFKDLDRDAQSLSELRLVTRKVTLRFAVWNSAAWVTHHPDRYQYDTRSRASRRVKHYSPDQDPFFVQFDGPVEDCFWFGILAEKNLLCRMSQVNRLEGAGERRLERMEFARQLDAPRGFATDRPGLLNPDQHVAARLKAASLKPGEILFEPESLYRGVLYGATIATIVLSNGSRVSELLQMSDSRWTSRLVPQVEVGQPTGEYSEVHLQLLLPKGQQVQRQLFPVPPAAARLLRDIAAGLVEAHGEIPQVHPHASSSKLSLAEPERFYFQWAASPDGRLGGLSEWDVTILLRFILFGVSLHTWEGKKIRVTTHLFRHVTATVARQDFGVPAEVVASVLHHTQRVGPGGKPLIPAATEYYSQMTERDKLAAMDRFYKARDAETRLVLVEPDGDAVGRINTNLRKVLDRWNSALPTAFGWCGNPDLCPREVDRGLCLGCPFLVPDPDKVGSARLWQGRYLEMADVLAVEGNIKEAREKRSQAGQLGDLVAMMGLLAEVDKDSEYSRLVASLSPPEGVAA